MSDAHANDIHLKVLPSSNKLEELKQEAARLAEAAATGRPLNPPAPPAAFAASTAAASKFGEPTTPDELALRDKVIGAIKTVYDPEIPINIYELGLIYDIRVDTASCEVYVKMTLTAPACPVAGTLPGEVGQRIEALPEVSKATIELVWEPTWTRERMSEAALLQLGML